MSEKFKVVIFAVAAAFIGGTTLTSCGEESTGEFRKVEDSTEIAGADAKKVKAKKEDKRGKDATPEYTGPVTSYTVNEEMHDFGEVENGSQNPFTFIITNTGDNPLVIEKAKGSCSCTVPKKPEDPIMPGESGEIEVTFKPKPSQAGKEITQVVTLTANTEPRDTKLKIKAKVQPKEEEEAQ
jgi:hypothetical protein